MLCLAELTYFIFVKPVYKEMTSNRKKTTPCRDLYINDGRKVSFSECGTREEKPPQEPTIKFKDMRICYA